MPNDQLNSLIADPDFAKLQPADQRRAMAGVTGDAGFSKLSDDDTTRYLSAHKATVAPIKSSDPTDVQSLTSIWNNLQNREPDPNDHSVFAIWKRLKGLFAAPPSTAPQPDSAVNPLAFTAPGSKQPLPEALSQASTIAGLGAGLGDNFGAGDLVSKGTDKIVSAPRRIVSALRDSPTAQAVTHTLPEDIASAPVSATRGASSGNASTAITNREVLQHAADEGILLTPAQALRTAAARSEQTFGEEAILTGHKVGESIAQQKVKLGNAVDEFQDRIDPHRIGLSAEATGEHLQQSAETARSALKDNVNHAYEQVGQQQADLAADIQKPLRELLTGETSVKQPSAAVARPVFKTAAAKAAIDDINGMLEDPALQGRASVESLRNLRTTLLEKGNDYSANGLADSGQRIYKIAAGKVDAAIMDAAKGTSFEQAFRDAGAQNSRLQSLYNSKGSPLYRILNTDDPAQVANGILNRSSVQEIEALRSEGLDTAPLARQAVEDIKNGGYRVTPSGLGSYPDTFLRSLLGPEATKELYLKAEIARRLSENYNASGSGRAVLGATQVLHPVAATAAQVARSRSMPKIPSTYLKP